MSAIREMIDILDEEYRLLTLGSYDGLPELLTRKEAQEGRLAKELSPENGLIPVLSSALERNAEIIAAAQRGFAQAQAQIREIREIREGLNQATYGRDGARRSLSRNPHSLEQKL
jgi:hypothetical protein